MFDFNLGLGAILVPVVLILLASSFRILREYERGVVFQLGRFWKVKGPDPNDWKNPFSLPLNLSITPRYYLFSPRFWKIKA